MQKNYINVTPPTAGELNQRISFLTCSRGYDNAGFVTDNWVESFKVWASVRSLTGREFFAALATQHEKDLVFIIRCKINITCEMRIKFHDEVYTIMLVDNIKWPKRFTFIRATTVHRKIGDNR